MPRALPLPVDVFVGLLVALLAGAFAAPSIAQTVARTQSAAPVAPIAIVATPGPHPHWLHLAPTDPEASGMIERGLDWLRRQQRVDGRWTAADDEQPVAGVHDVAITGLCVLAFAREGRPPADSPDRAALARAVQWLADQQSEAKGKTPAGRLGPAATPDYVYNHAIGTLALAAAVVAFDSETGKRALAPALEYLAFHRNPYAVWRYMPRDGDNDTSVSTWCTLACVAGVEAGGKVDAGTFQAMSHWLDAVTDDQGRTGYSKRGEGSSRTVAGIGRFPPERGETLTAAGLLCRHALGQDERQVPTLAASRELLLAKRPNWDPERGDVDYCGWFFGSEAMRRCRGEVRQAFRTALVAAAAKGQHREGPHQGSWDPVDPWSHLGGRPFATALMVLALQGLYAPAAK